MEGREHIFWSLILYSLSMFLYTVIFDFRDLSAKWYLVLLILLCLAIVMNDVANYVNLKNKMINKNRAKDVGKIKLSKWDKAIVYGGYGYAYIFLVFLMGYTGVVSMPIATTSLYLILGFMVTVFGGILPDLDIYVFSSAKFHRNIVTHSGMIPVIIGILALLICPIDQLSALIAFAGFLTGTASHLICDQFGSKETLAHAFVGLFKYKSAPGDLRLIRNKREREWLFLQFFFVVFVILLLWMRVGQMGFMNYSPAWNGTSMIWTPVPISLVILVVIYYLLTLVSYHAWKDKKKKKRD